MSTLSELFASGITRARLPRWNEHAYVEPVEAGALGVVRLFDVLHGVGGGEPLLLPFALHELDIHTDWEPA